MMKKYIVGSFMCILLAGCSATPASESHANEETTSQQSGEQTQTNTDTTTNREAVQMVTLNTGETVTFGDTIAVDHSFYEGHCTYTGVVTNIYEETGRVWERTYGAVNEFNYRMVVDVQATERHCNPEEGEQVEAINREIRSVVRLDKEGKELISYIRDINPEQPLNRRIKITEMKSYQPAQLYDIGTDGTQQGQDNIPQEVLDFYNAVGMTE